MSMTRQRIGAGVFGLVLGYALARMGFADFDEVHKMFMLKDIRLILVFGLGVVVTGAVFAILRRAKTLPHRTFHTGIVVGSILFGLGWALCGACPGVMFVQLGAGTAPVVVTLGGALIGTRVATWANAKYFHWDETSCG